MTTRLLESSVPEFEFSNFHKTVPEVTGLIVSNLDDYRDLLSFCIASKIFQDAKEGYERTLYSQIPIFGHIQWKQYWNVEITDQFDPNKIDVKALRVFLRTYYGPSPKDPGRPEDLRPIKDDPIRLVKDVCLMPAVVPFNVKKPNENDWSNLTLNLLGELARQPKEGHSVKYDLNDIVGSAIFIDENPLELFGNIGVNPACPSLVIILKDIVGRTRWWSSNSAGPFEKDEGEYGASGQVELLQYFNETTKYGCEPEPDALSQNTVLMAHFAVLGIFPLGDNDTSNEIISVWTREFVENDRHEFRMTTAIPCLDPLSEGEDAALNIGFYSNHEEGVVVMKKILNEEKK